MCLCVCASCDHFSFLLSWKSFSTSLGSELEMPSWVTLGHGRTVPATRNPVYDFGPTSLEKDVCKPLPCSGLETCPPVFTSSVWFRSYCMGQIFGCLPLPPHLLFIVWFQRRVALSQCFLLEGSLDSGSSVSPTPR